MNPQEIINFIKYQLERGVTRPEIERVLKLNQVSAEAIEAGFRSVGPVTSSAPATGTSSTSTPPTTPTSTKPASSVPAPTPTGPVSPPPPATPVMSAFPSVNSSSGRHSGVWLWVVIIVFVLILLGGGVFAYLKLGNPPLVTVTPTPTTTSALPVAPVTSQADPTKILSDFKQKMPTLSALDFTLEFMGTTGSGTLTWTEASSTITASLAEASSTPISLELPFSLSASSTEMAIFTPEAAETLPNGTATYRYRVGFGAQEGQLWLDEATGLPRQLLLVTNESVLKLLFL